MHVDYRVRRETSHLFEESIKGGTIIQNPDDSRFALLLTDKSIQLLSVKDDHYREISGNLGQRLPILSLDDLKADVLGKTESGGSWFIKKGVCGRILPREIAFFNLHEDVKTCYRLYVKDKKLCFCSDEFCCDVSFSKIIKIEVRGVVTNDDSRETDNDLTTSATSHEREITTRAYFYIETDKGNYKINAEIASHLGEPKNYTRGNVSKIGYPWAIKDCLTQEKSLLSRFMGAFS